MMFILPFLLLKIYFKYLQEKITSFHQVYFLLKLILFC